jgi:putative NIF3 family GTP cyclohydrolase 1 type 2
MTLKDLDRWLSDFLDLPAVAAIDRSRNGLQVARRGGDLRRVAFAVDASLATFRRAADWAADAFVTGESAHQVYHFCLEERINAIFAGHYRTESYGVKSLATRLAKDTDLETTWLDVPTGL